MMDNHTSSKGTSSQVLPVTTVYRVNHPQVVLRGCSPFEQPHYFNYSHFFALEDYNEKLPCCHRTLQLFNMPVCAPMLLLCSGIIHQGLRLESCPVDASWM